MAIDLKNLLSTKSFSRKEKVLIILHSEKESLKSVSTIREIGIQNGLREIKKWNVSQVLTSLSDAVTKFPNGWAITDQGKSFLRDLGVDQSSPSKKIQPLLRRYSGAIKDLNIKSFVDEAIDAIEFKLFRSAVVLSWVGALSVLYEQIYFHHLPVFNAEAIKRFPKWKPAVTKDDLSRMKEFDFLQVLNAISVIDKSTKDELEQCLKLRNGCGHPNALKVGEHRVTAHLETLILNIFAKFTI
jgi:hypothetical protein